jgi:hypothetical protein
MVESDDRVQDPQPRLAAVEDTTVWAQARSQPELRRRLDPLLLSLGDGELGRILAQLAPQERDLALRMIEQYVHHGQSDDGFAQAARMARDEQQVRAARQAGWKHGSQGRPKHVPEQYRDYAEHYSHGYADGAEDRASGVLWISQLAARG